MNREQLWRALGKLRPDETEDYVDATIEACAQVADEHVAMGCGGGCGDLIASKIRALRSE